MHALEEDIKKYEGRYSAGYAAIREARHQKMRELGIIEDWPLSPAPTAWDEIPEEEKAWELRSMEVYAAMIDSMDQGVGRIVNALKEKGVFENTLILFLSDNGGSHETLDWFARKKVVQAQAPMGKDKLQTKMFPSHTRQGQPILTGKDAMPGPPNTYMAYGENWANVSNTPFREHKSRNHEGGIATPLIAHWPKGIPANNELRHRPGHVIDLMATCLEVSGADYPETVGSHRIQPYEGLSLVPSFAEDENPDRVLMFEHYGRAAIRDGKWKLVRLGQEQAWELYDLEKDRSELKDLAKQLPEKVRALEARWTQEAWRTRIYPKPNDGK